MKFKLFVFGLIVTFLASSLSAFAAAYPDTDGHEYEVSIEILTDMGVLNGYPDGTFKPDQELNRAEFLKIVLEGRNLNWEMLGFVDELTIDIWTGRDTWFEDVPLDQWYSKYVSTAFHNGYVVGYENGKYFKPEQSVTFVEALKMSYEILGMPYFGDWDGEEPDPWFRGLVEDAGYKNLIPLSIPSFHHQITRGEMADMVARIIQHKEGGIYAYHDRANTLSYEALENGTGPHAFDLQGDCEDGTYSYKNYVKRYEFCYPNTGVIDEITAAGVEIWITQIPYSVAKLGEILHLPEGTLESYVEVWENRSNVEYFTNTEGVEAVKFDYETNWLSYFLVFKKPNQEIIYEISTDTPEASDLEFLEVIEDTFKFMN